MQRTPKPTLDHPELVPAGPSPPAVDEVPMTLEGKRRDPNAMNEALQAEPESEPQSTSSLYDMVSTPLCIAVYPHSLLTLSMHRRVARILRFTATEY